MLSLHDQEIKDYMIENHNGKCAYNTAKQCDGLCNNCPYDYEMKKMEQMQSGSYIPHYTSKIYNAYLNCCNDYEGAILARQENC